MVHKSENLKIGFVLDDGLDKPDGVQQYVLAMGEWLRSQGHDVHYLVGETKRTDLINVHSLSRNVAVRFNGNRMTIPLPAGYRKLRRFIQANNFDVLHVQMPYSPFMGRRVVRAAAPTTAVVGSFHIAPVGWLVAAATRLLGLWLRQSLRRFDRFLAVSPVAADFARRTWGISCEVSPNVFNYDRFHRLPPREKRGQLIILFFGRLVPRKGCRVLLQAAVRLRDQNDLPEYRIVIAGDGPLRGELEDYVRSHDLESVVEFTGFVDEADKAALLAGADIAVFPSSSGESFGIVLLEAMATGQAAVLAGDNPGYRSVMSARPGLLFDPQNAEALFQKLATYLQDEKLRRAAAAWGADYSRGFDTETVGRKLLVTYRQALRSRPKP